MAWNRLVALSRSKLAPWKFRHCGAQRCVSLLTTSSQQRFLSSSLSNKYDEAANRSNDSSNNPQNNDGEAPSLDEARTAILLCALQQVHQYGWTEDALAAAAVVNQKASASMSVAGMITTDDLIGFCMDQWNAQLKSDLQNRKSQQKHNSAELAMPESVDQLLMKGLKTRLEYLIPYLESNWWHEGMALGIRGPGNAMQTERQLREMIEIIANSSSVASSHNLGVPERMALGAVYVATELHLLTDSSPGYQDSWSFLESRMTDWRKLASLATTLPSPGSRHYCAGQRGGDIPNNSPSMGVQDSFFVLSSVASSLAGGLVSLVVNPKPSGAVTASFGLPDAVWQSLFQNPQNLWGQSDAISSVPGSHPSHYDLPPTPSAPTSSSTKNAA